MAIEIQFEPETTGRPLSDSRLQGVENNLGVLFPREYVEFLRKSNGGVPIENLFTYGTNEKVVERFLSLLDDYKNDPLGQYDLEVVWSQIEGRLDDHLVPFGELFAGDFVCFNFREQPEPDVVLWDHEQSREDAPFTVKIADSFVSFVQMLYTAS